MDSIIGFLADVILLGEAGAKIVLLFMGVMAIIWTFQLMRDPAKQLELAMDLFKKIFVWAWKGLLLIWLLAMWFVNMIVRVFSVTFATIRDFFISKN